MSILGINGTTNGLWVAVVDADGDIVRAQASIAISENTPLDVQINGAVEESRRLLDSHSISRVSILDAEPSTRFQPSFAQLVPRISLEAAVMLAANRAGVEAIRRSRAWVRATLGLPKTGALTSHVDAVAAPQAPHWSNKRDLAALVALAELRH